MGAFSTISVHELAQLSQQEERAEVIDVRTPAEFRQIHVTIARNVPLDSLDPHQLKAARQGNDNHPLYVICKSGGRSKLACEKLVQAGLTNVVDVEGGTQAWEQAGLEVERGRQTMSLERQVRITAGCLVVVGSLLGVLVHPAFMGIAGFVGAGLVHSGITDSCAMGMLMAKIPWNQVKQAPAEPAAVCTS